MGNKNVDARTQMSDTRKKTGPGNRREAQDSHEHNRQTDREREGKTDLNTQGREH